jgi:RHS repeat-associated protein
MNANIIGPTLSGYDGHNNVRYLTDVNGNVTDTYDYDAFGNLTAASGDTVNYYLFTGEQFDLDLGLYYLRARYHNPDTGRFWNMDSYEGDNSDPASLHKYTYCGNNPANAHDPSGHDFTLGESMTVLGLSVNVRFMVGTLAGFYVGGAYGALNAYMHGGDMSQVAQGFAVGGLSGALFGGLLGPVPPAFWTSALGRTFLATMSITSLSSAAVNYEEGQNLMAAIDVVSAVAPWLLTSGQVGLLLDRFYGNLGSKWSLIDTLQANGVKLTRGAVIDIAQLDDERIVFLEKGNANKGFEHILKDHLAEFETQGISERQLPSFLMKALKTGKVIDTQGRSRSIYEFQYGGQTYRVAIELGSNGFIVSANPRPRP